FHMLLDAHDMVIANGMETESFQPSVRNYLDLPIATKNSLTAQVPRDEIHSLFNRPDAMRTLKGYEVDVLMTYMFARGTHAVSQAPRVYDDLRAAA
ncbi:MAG: hypothetical protein V7730_22015, partial [Sulfitobacter sp.]